MKKTTKTALTAAIFAAALGVSAGSSLPAEAEMQRYLAATDQRTMQILYGPGPDYNPHKTGDISDDLVLDARDLTLMKRDLLSSSPPQMSAANRHYDFRSDSVINGTDARALMQYLTGAEEDSMHPVEFTVYFRPVPYLSDSVPESEAERKALEEAGEDKLASLSGCMFNAVSSDRQWAVRPRYLYSTVSNAECDILLNGTYLLRIPDGFYPNEEIPLNETDTALGHRSELNAEFIFEEIAYRKGAAPEGEGPDVLVPDFVNTISSECKISCSFPTFISDPEKGDIYYDKCLVEWDVNTNKTRISKSLTPYETIPDLTE